MYRAIVLPSLLYGAETWLVYEPQVQHLQDETETPLANPKCQLVCQRGYVVRIDDNWVHDLTL